MTTQPRALSSSRTPFTPLLVKKCDRGKAFRVSAAAEEEGRKGGGFLRALSKRKGSREVPSPLKSSFRTVGKLTQENLLSHSQVGFFAGVKKRTQREREWAEVATCLSPCL